MANNKEGGKKGKDTLRKKLGVRGYKEFMTRIGAKGGRAKVPKGLAMLKRFPVPYNEIDPDRLAEVSD